MVPVPMPPTLISVAILAGGQSRRMGRDKATILVDGTPLIARVAAVLAATGHITIVGGEPTLPGSIDLASIGHIPDRYPGEGPLGGLVSALRSTSAPWTLVAACDLPNLDGGAIGSLVAAGIQNNADVALPLVGGERQWHCALWSARAADVLQAAFDSGVRSLRAAAADLGQTLVVPTNPSSYIDIDTADDLQRFETSQNRN